MAQEKTPRLGVWITVFSPEEVLHSKENTDRLIDVCAASGVTDIYLQVYRADKAYYNSDITDRTPFDSIIASSGEDLIPYLIKQASSNNIKVHAWVNLLSLAQNTDANILKKYGNEVLTFDQHGNPSMPLDKKDKLTPSFIYEDQLFLEPGDWRVRDYLSGIVGEILTKYPNLSGVHMDYIRYPSVVPFIPGARFTSHGISYGYNKLSLLNFEKATGLNAEKMAMSRSNAALWDNWRREQVTKMVSYLSEDIRKTSPSLEISATVIPSLERTYLVTFQNWTDWLRSGLVDNIVVMNYTDDTPLMELRSQGVLIPGFEKNIQMGVGAYLLNEKPEVLNKQLEYARSLPLGGVVIFSYDELANNEDLQAFLSKTFRRSDK